ncbi:MAG: lasso RiPP family leader peptide-containing protein [Rubricoccaceae bacterium]
MKEYAAPRVVNLGDIRALTGLFGTSSRPDVLVNPQGQIVERGTSSLDACPTQHPGPEGTCAEGR